MNPHIVSIGYGRQLFVPNNSERERLAHCAKETASLHMIVFSLRTHGLAQEQVTDTFTLYPTHSAHRFFMLFDAIRIGMRIARKRKPGEKWCITAQDPLASGVVGFVLAKLTRIPLVVQEHGDIFSGSYWKNESVTHRLWYVVARYVAHSAERVRAVSLRVKKHLEDSGVKEERIVVLPVYTDVSKFLHTVNITEEPRETCTILSVARFVKQKNLLLLLRAFAHVYAGNRQARLILVGSGHEQEALEKEIEILNIRSVVTILPWTDDVVSLMRSADAYALSSNYEGWGRVLIEAMACGVPSVTTEVGCVGEVFIHEKHGMVVPIGDESAFADALKELVENAPKRVRFGVQGSHDAASLFPSIQTYASAWAKIHLF